MHEPAQVVAGGAGERGGGRWSLRRHAPKGRLRPHAPESLGRFADFAPPVGVGGVDVSVRVLQRGGGRPSGRDGGAPTASLGASLPLLHEANRKRELALINSRPGADQQFKDVAVAKVEKPDEHQQKLCPLSPAGSAGVRRTRQHGCAVRAVACAAVLVMHAAGTLTMSRGEPRGLPAACGNGPGKLELVGQLSGGGSRAGDGRTWGAERLGGAGTPHMLAGEGSPGKARAGCLLRLALRLQGGQEEDVSDPELPQDLESSLGLMSNSELEDVDWDAPGLQDVRFTPAARAYMDKKMQEFMEYTEPKTTEEEGVALHDEPDEDFQERAAAKLNAVLQSHPDRRSKVRGRNGFNVTGPCAHVHGSVWDYIHAAGDDVESGNSSEFEEYLNEARAAFNRSDTREPSGNPQDEFDDDVVRDPAFDWAFQHMTPPDNWEARYYAWRSMQIRARSERKHKLQRQEEAGAQDSRDGPSDPPSATQQDQAPRNTATQQGQRAGATSSAAAPEDSRHELDVGLPEGPLGLEHGADDGEEEEEETEGELGESDHRPLNPPVADARMHRNFARPVKLAGQSFLFPPFLVVFFLKLAGCRAHTTADALG